MKIMKRLPVFLVVMSLIVGSLFSAMHAHASGFSDDTVQVIQSLDDTSDNHSNSNFVECEQCCHTGCHHIAMNNQSSTNHAPASSKHFISSGESYLSQLNSPPFQPPRA